MSVAIVLTDDISACLALRRAVFIDEQNVSEADEIDDLDAISLHLLAVDGETPVGTARVTIRDGVAKIGRVCVLKPYRGAGLGAGLVRKAIEASRGKATQAKLGSQLHALEFYAALGFVALGPVYDDAGIDHRDMVRDL